MESLIAGFLGKVLYFIYFSLANTLYSDTASIVITCWGVYTFWVIFLYRQYRKHNYGYWKIALFLFGGTYLLNVWYVLFLSTSALFSPTIPDGISRIESLYFLSLCSCGIAIGAIIYFILYKRLKKTKCS